MEKVINIYKPVGKTPLDMVKEVKKNYPDLKNAKIGYAGRLDPMAHGVLLLLVHPETKNRTDYQNLDKVYEFEVLFGVTSDTGDVLGMVKQSALRQFLDSLTTEMLESNMKVLRGTREQTYPPYSSKRIKGKPLFYWARKGKLNIIKLPKKTVTISTLQLIEFKFIPTGELKFKVLNKLKEIKGDFRQREIATEWEKLFMRTKISRFPVAVVKSYVSSGTYIRGLARELGDNIGTGALAMDIKRTSVGHYNINNSIRI